MSNSYGPAVDDAIMGDLFPNGQEPMGLFNQGDQAVKSTVEALRLIEKHLEPVTSEQLAALAILRLEGGQFATIAEFFLEHHQLRGSGQALVEGLGHASLIRSFRGVQGSLIGGKPGVFGGPGGGRR